MRNLQTVKDQVFQLKKPDGSFTTDHQEAAEELSRAFMEVFTVEDEARCLIDTSIPAVEVDSRLLDQHLVNLFTEEVVYKRLSTLDSGKSAGPDGLHPHLLKECASSIAKPLANICQDSLTQGQIPSDWKLANVCPIFKKGSRNVAGNYRPVSLTSVACKVMESVIKGVLTEFANIN